MTIEKTLKYWIENEIPAHLRWGEVEKICKWLCTEYGFTFHPPKTGTHYVLAHNLLAKYKDKFIQNGILCHCNYNGEYSIKRESNVKKVYIKYILEAYQLIKGLKQ